MPWVLRMAWRDSRGSRWRLLLYTAAIAVGIAALAPGARAVLLSGLVAPGVAQLRRSSLN